MGTPQNSSLYARQLANLACYLYASPRYLEQFGDPSHPSDLAQHECLGFRTGKPSAWQLRKDGESIEVYASGRFQLNSVGLIRRLAALDQGIALIPAEIVAEDVSLGRLRRVLPDWEGQPPVYAMTETRLLPAKTQRFIQDFARAPQRP